MLYYKLPDNVMGNDMAVTAAEVSRTKKEASRRTQSRMKGLLFALAIHGKRARALSPPTASLTPKSFIFVYLIPLTSLTHSLTNSPTLPNPSTPVVMVPRKKLCSFPLNAIAAPRFVAATAATAANDGKGRHMPLVTRELDYSIIHSNSMSSRAETLKRRSS